MCEKYQGWTNYETWAVKLWIDNEEPDYRYWQAETRRHLATAKPAFDFQTKEDAARIGLAGQLKDEHEEAATEALNSDNKPTVFTDLLNAALGSVNWHEIAASLIADVKEEAEL